MSAYLYIIFLIYLSGTVAILLIPNFILNIENGAATALASLRSIHAIICSTMPFWFDLIFVVHVRNSYIQEIKSFSPLQADTRNGALHAFDHRTKCRRSYQRRSAPLAWAFAVQMHGLPLVFDILVNFHARRFGIQLDDEVAMRQVSIYPFANVSIYP